DSNRPHRQSCRCPDRREPGPGTAGDATRRVPVPRSSLRSRRESMHESRPGPRIGVMLPNSGAVGGGAYAVVEAARQAERLGFDSVWSVDHLAFHSGVLEPVVTLAAAAAVTERVELGFGVLLAALRHPALLAKQLGSLHTLSGDRLHLGIGVGGENPAEWAAAGVPVA